MLYKMLYSSPSVVVSALLLTLIFSPTTKAVEFSLFGDVSFNTSNDNEAKNSFHLGQIDLIAYQDIGPHTNVVVELVFEDAGQGTGTSIDIERFAIDRNITENMQFGFGRYHTPLGFWNTSFHHGSLIQNTAARPFFLEFEDAFGGIMPVHMVGIKLSGLASFINYQFILGNNNGLNSDNAASLPTTNRLSVFNSSDLNNKKSYVARLGINAFDSNFEVGFNFLKNNVIEMGTVAVTQGDVLFNQEITGLSLSWKLGNLSILSEAYQIEITDPNLPVESDTYTSDAIYTQFSYHMSPRLTLSLRYESLEFETGNTYLTALGITTPEERNTLSLSYNIEKSNALRFEFNQRKFDDLTLDAFSSYTFQWYFLLI